MHFTGLLEDTCPDVVDVSLSFLRFLQRKVEGALGVHESEFGVRVLGELSRRARRQWSPR